MTRMLTAGMILVALGGCASTQAVELNQAAWRDFDRRQAALRPRVDAVAAGISEWNTAQAAWQAKVERWEAEWERIEAHPAWPRQREFVLMLTAVRAADAKAAGVAAPPAPRLTAEQAARVTADGAFALWALEVAEQGLVLQAERTALDERRAALTGDRDRVQTDLNQLTADLERIAARERAESRRRAVWSGVAAGLSSMGQSMSTWRPAPSQRIAPFTCREIGYQIRCF